MTPEPLTLSDIQKARQRISSCVRRTQTSASATLSDLLKTTVYVKLELFQKTGSFKIRGVFNKVLSMSPEARAKGLVAVSGGNHAQAVSYVARALDIKARILMPSGAPRNQIEASRGYGARVDFAASAAEAFAEVGELEREGWTFIHPFDDPAIMAGQGTMGLEILEDAPQMTDIVLAIGGGGMLTGVATAIKTLKPSVHIWGVETEGADCMARSIEAGKIVTLESITSKARSLGAAAPSERTFAAAKKLLESVTVVTDTDAIEASEFLMERLKVVAEPAAAATLAGADLLSSKFTGDRHVVLLLAGGNVSVAS